MGKKTSAIKLFVTDIDNTLFDWVTYYVTALDALLQVVAEKTGASLAVLSEEAKQVFESHGSIEYPFLVQELPSVNQFYSGDIDKMLIEIVKPARAAFAHAGKQVLRTYDDVIDTLAEIRATYPDMKLVALTDAPRYVAMWKLNKLGILHSFHAVYGLPDPRLPTDNVQGRVKVDPEILLKHLQKNDFGFQGKIRILPDEYEKPGTRGLKTVLMDYEMDEDPEHRRQVLWVGDNLKKDVGLGRSLGIKTAWASYGGTVADHHVQRLLQISPPLNIMKHANLPSGSDMPKPDLKLDTFRDILQLL